MTPRAHPRAAARAATPDAWAEHGWGLSASQAASLVSAIALAGLLLRFAGA